VWSALYENQRTGRIPKKKNIHSVVPHIVVVVHESNTEKKHRHLTEQAN